MLNVCGFSGIFHLSVVKTFKILPYRFLKYMVHYYYPQVPGWVTLTRTSFSFNYIYLFSVCVRTCVYVCVSVRVCVYVCVCVCVYAHT